MISCSALYFSICLLWYSMIFSTFLSKNKHFHWFQCLYHFITHCSAFTPIHSGFASIYSGFISIHKKTNYNSYASSVFTISLLIVQHSHPYTRTPKTTMLPVLSLFNYSLFSLYIHTFSIYIHTFNIHILYIQHSHPYARTKKPTSLPAASSPFQYS